MKKIINLLFVITFMLLSFNSVKAFEIQPKTVETEYIQTTVQLGSYGSTDVKIKISYNYTTCKSTIKSFTHTDHITKTCPTAYVSSVTISPTINNTIDYGESIIVKVKLKPSAVHAAITFKSTINYSSDNIVTG